MGVTAGRRAAGFGAAAVLALTGCAAGGDDPAASAASRFSEGGVAVTVRVESGDGVLRVVADLRPERAGFHLYSLALPDGGVGGIGIPTRIRAEGALRPTGPAATDARERVLSPEGLGVRLPVYQDGEVTLELPVRRVADAHGARVFLTYGACSEHDGCLAPVRDRAVSVPLGD
ncbi:hypothetical protein ACFYXS_18620 [Streptomyces sp. NPDC002574]|uniref:hypothetical protein n=1 Tax=Streptomyces sp. NPDC002574 TaxID=3364652 RepID=UPI0036ACA8BE